MDTSLFRFLRLFLLTTVTALVACAGPIDSNIDEEHDDKADLAAVLRWQQQIDDASQKVTYTGYGADEFVEVELSLSYNGTEMIIDVFNYGYGEGRLVTDMATAEILENTLPNEQITTENIFELIAMVSAASAKEGGPNMQATSSSYSPTNNDCIDGNSLLDWVPRTCGDLVNGSLAIAAAGIVLWGASIGVGLVVAPALGVLVIQVGLATGVASIASAVSVLAAMMTNTLVDCRAGGLAQPVYWCE